MQSACASVSVRCFAALALWAGAVHVSHAQTPLAGQEPGLWEVRLVEGDSLASLALGVQQTLQNLPEAQRRQLERLMGKGGVMLPTVIRHCLTPEMARRDIRAELAAREVECSELDWQESADGGRFSFVCRNRDGDWTGQGRITDAAPKRFRSEAQVQGRYRGQPVSLDMKHEARWLGPDCQAGQSPR